MTSDQFKAILARFNIDWQMPEEKLLEELNHAIYQIALDNPENVYPKDRQNGIYHIDWDKEIITFREDRRASCVGFNALYPLETTTTFDMVQKIRFFVHPDDYKNNELTNKTFDTIFDNDEV